MKMILKLLLLISLFIPAAGYAQENKPAKKFLDIIEVTSPGGIKAWLVEDHTIPVIALEFSFRDTGSKTDPAQKQGIAQFASNMLDEGAGDLTSEVFQKELQDKSISLSFDADRDNFSGSLKTLTANKDRAFELLKLSLTKPRFDPEPLERMRAANQSRIRGSMTNPNWMAARLQNDRLYEGHPYSRNSGGTLTTLAAITADDLRSFHKTLGKNRIVVSASGDITPEQLQKILDDVFGTLPEAEAAKQDKTDIKNAGKTFLFEQDIPQTIIEIAQKGIGRDDPDYHSAQIMNFILGGSGFGSRLTDEIREKRGLTYGIYSYFREYEAAKVFHVATSTENKNVADMISLIKAEWEKMKDQSISEKELTEAKSYLIGSLPLSLTSTGAIASLMNSLQLDNLPSDYLDKRSDIIRAVTIEDVQKTAQKLLDENAFTTIMVGKPIGIENAEIITKLPNVE